MYNMASGAPQHRPTNTSELQLYRVLERANLLGYYDNFIQQGGDDVQQLCEAGEEEFLEIMALVGMATKPLHVRRLQKALQEWVSNPTGFQQPVATPTRTATQTPGLIVTTPGGSTSQSNWQTPPLFQSFSPNSEASPPIQRAKKVHVQHASGESAAPIVGGFVLDQESVANIREAAATVLKFLGPQSPMQFNKKVMKEIEHVFEMAPNNPDRMTEIRKYSAIYGRFDSKRRADKQLTQHEASVNEAAAQICAAEIPYLAQRDKLFPLARQVVRESGYKFKHGHSRAGVSKAAESGEEESPAAKKIKIENNNPYRDNNLVPNPRTVQAELMKLKRQERMNEIQESLKMIKKQQDSIKVSVDTARKNDDLQTIYDLQMKLEKLTAEQLSLMTEQTDLIKRQRRSDRYYVAKARLSTDPCDNGYMEREDAGESDPDNPDIHVPVPHHEHNSTGSITPPLSPQHESPENNKPEKMNKSLKKNHQQSQKRIMQHMLMDEGLRIAHEHALAYEEECQIHGEDDGGDKDVQKVKPESGEAGTECENSDCDENSETAANRAAQNTIHAILNLRAVKQEPSITT